MRRKKLEGFGNEIETAPDWIGAFKGPPRFSRVSPLHTPVRLTLIGEREDWDPVGVISGVCGVARFAHA